MTDRDPLHRKSLLLRLQTMLVASQVAAIKSVTAPLPRVLLPQRTPESMRIMAAAGHVACLRVHKQAVRRMALALVASPEDVVRAEPFEAVELDVAELFGQPRES